jgi:geranyl-CoA carboxylase alpha subunit
MGAAAVAAAKAIGYTSAGTVEFLLAGDGAFYFLEMNTRLQVEHPVTECVTGLDLVELQIRIAGGEPLPLAQKDVGFHGHAIEARLYAEAPHKGFLPQSGKLVAWEPPAGAGIRVDHGLRSGQTVSPFYDPLLAKVIAHGATRDEARRRLIHALEETIVLGPATNRAFLIDGLRHEAFAAGQATTQFIPKYFADVVAPAADPAALALAAVLWFEASARRHGHDPARAWASSGALAWPLRLEAGEKSLAHTVSVLGPGRYRVEGGERPQELEIGADGDGGRIRFRLDGAERPPSTPCRRRFAPEVGASDLTLRETLYEPHAAEGISGAADNEVRAPMNGRIVAVLVAEGDAVEKGQRLVVVEAMKMQHELTAQVAGRIARLAVKTGDQVATRQVLVELKPIG